MWRTSKKALFKAPSLVDVQRRCASGGSAAGSSLAKSLLWTTGALTAGAGGAVGYAWYDPEFRRNIEKNIPQSKELFQKVLGVPRDTSKPVIEIQGAKEIGDKISTAVTSVIPSRKETKESDTAKPSPGSASTNKPTVQSAPAKSTGSAQKSSEKDEELQKRWKERDEAVEKERKQLEQRLRPMMSRMEDAVKTAIDTKLKVVTLLEQHTKRVKAAVETTIPDENESQWKAVNDIYESVKQASKLDESSDAEARSQVERLRKAINEGLASKNISDDPLLTQASETLNRWNYQLNEATSKMRQAQTEQRITSEFKKLIQEGREQFAKELKSILPNVDIHAKGKKLTEDELNALIAHAHVRVDQLRRQLAEQQSHEQQHIEQALERQKAENARLMEEKMEKALSNRRSEQEVELRVQLQEARSEFEDELRKQMRRQAAAHSEHLEDVLKTTRTQMESQCQRNLDEALLKEHDNFNRELLFAIARLRAIEVALEGRAELDSENRRSKELWLACQHLKKAVLHGRSEGRDYTSRKKPLVKEIGAVKEAGVADPFVKTLLTSIRSEAVSQGVFTQDDLVDRFQKVKKVCQRTALIGDNGGTLFQYSISYLQSFFLLDRVKPTSKDLQEIDPLVVDTVGVLWRASHFVDQMDFESAIKLLQLLKGEPARLASDWIKDARLHLETRRTAELLLAHASAVSMRTIY